MAASLRFRQVRAGDIAYVGEHMRADDWREVEATYGNTDTPAEAIAHSLLRSSHAWTAVDAAGTPVAIFGLCPISVLEGIGSPWLLATDALHKHPRTLVAMSKRYLPSLSAIYPHLCNYVGEWNEKSIRWLDRLGFQIHPPAPYGAGGLMFRKFELRV